MDVSVIIATKNRGAWLPTCLTHLEQQAFPAAQFEVLVADCGSSDGTPSVLDRFASGSPIRIRPLVYEEASFALARNRAVGEAQGRILLFLADDELASPRLVENHVAAHEESGGTHVAIGTITGHPQLPAESVTRLFLRDVADPRDRQEPIGFLDWPESNTSILRRVFDAFGGYTTSSDFLNVEHLELAARLTNGGVHGLRVHDTRSYVWQPAVLDTERVQAYNAGYSLYFLTRETKSKGIPQRYRLRRSRPEQFVARFLLPFYVRACRRQETENKLFVGALYRRILSHDRSRGFEDAFNSRPRRPPAVEGPPSAPAAIAGDQWQPF